MNALLRVKDDAEELVIHAQGFVGWIKVQQLVQDRGGGSIWYGGNSIFEDREAMVIKQVLETDDQMFRTPWQLCKTQLLKVLKKKYLL